jgi:PAS domain-containing protein
MDWSSHLLILRWLKSLKLNYKQNSGIITRTQPVQTMKKPDKGVNEATLLRLIAEEELKNAKTDHFDLAELDNRKLIHELQVHQIEMEMQNEELKKAHAKAYEAIEKYVELYDFAPSGYLTLSKEGNILELNFAAAAMLGKNRSHLNNTRFGLHISHDSLRAFNLLLNRTFMLNEKESCELLLLHKTATIEKTMYVHIDAKLSKDSTKCLLNMTDISERKKLEIELNKTINLLREHNLYKP